MWFGYAIVGYHIQHREKLTNDFRIVVDIYLSWMDGLVPDNADNVKRLLDSGWKSLLHQFPDVVIEVFAWQP